MPSALLWLALDLKYHIKLQQLSCCVLGAVTGGGDMKSGPTAQRCLSAMGKLAETQCSYVCEYFVLQTLQKVCLEKLPSVIA